MARFKAVTLCASVWNQPLAWAKRERADIAARAVSRARTRHAGGRLGGGHQGGGGGERGGGQEQYDPALLQGRVHQRLQEDYWSGLSGTTDTVSVLFEFDGLISAPLAIAVTCKFQL